MSKRVFLSGPISGVEDYRERFAEKAAEVWNAGDVPFDPALIELKACPFCGGEATYGKVLGFSCEGRCVKCIKCGARSVPHMIDLPHMTANGLDESTRYTEEQAKEKAAEAWNRRADDE